MSRESRLRYELRGAVGPATRVEVDALLRAIEALPEFKALYGAIIAGAMPPEWQMPDGVRR